jgi:hypothetical protein
LNYIEHINVKTDVMSEHGIIIIIIIICCFMSAFWLASTSAHCLRPTTFDVTTAVTQLSLVSPNTNKLQKLISYNPFGHRASESSGMWLYKAAQNKFIEL